MQSLLGELAIGIRCALEPITNALHSPEELRDLLRSLGWSTAAVQADVDNLRASMAAGEALFNGIQTLAQRLEQGDPDELAVAGDLVDIVGQTIELIRGLTSAPTGGLPAPLDNPAFWSEAPAELIDLMILRFLRKSTPAAYGFLLLTGLAEVDDVDPGDAGRLPYTRHKMRWDRFPQVVSDPVGLLKGIYHWDDGSPFDHARLSAALCRVFDALSLPARLAAPRPALLNRYFDGGNPSLASVREVAVPLFTQADQGWTAYTEFGASICPVPPPGDRNGAPVGFVITPLATGTLGAGTDLGGGFFVRVKGGFDTDDAFGIEVRPSGVALRAEPGTSRFDAELSFGGQPDQPWRLWGAENSHRIELGGFYGGLQLGGPVSDPEFVIEIGTGKGNNPPKLALIIQMSAADGFLRHIIGTEPQRLELGGLVHWSSKTGLTFSGTAGLRMVLPVNLDLGIVAIDSLTLAVEVAGGGAALTLGASGRARLGPVAASVQNVGIKLLFDARGAGEPRGNLGDLDLSLAFKPPDGLGIVVDAGPITGGGFLSIEDGRYSGILQLSLFGIGVTAIGLLDTVLPGGEPGFALLIIISVELPPIQLGFGFTLNGVGGLAGINRTMVVETLQAGLRNGGLDNILFPEDPVANASRLISDLRAVFPPAEGRHVFGPMVKLGWGTPMLLEADLGILLEVPDPIRLVILGQLSAILPSKEAAILELHLDVLGIIDFGAKLLSVDASLHDSRLLAWSLSGDMALRLSWGTPPNFALSVGGLNPHFDPPPGFPSLRRLTVSLGTGDNPRISMQTYFAVTSNSRQTGALAELYAEACGFNVYGWIGYDTLIIFSPFSFIVDFSAGIALRRGTSTIAGIHLNATLSGPSPFHAWGEACLSILFFDVCVGFDATFGESKSNPLPSTDPWTPLRDAIQDPRNWSGGLPPAPERVITVSVPAGSAAPVLVDPGGSLTFQQKVLPLDRPITKFAEGTPTGPDHYTVQTITIGGAGGSFTMVDDYFAPAEFQKMSDAEKLSRDSFEKMHAGATVSSSAVTHGEAIGTHVEYETKIIDDPWDGRPAPVFILPNALLLSAARASAAMRSAPGRAGLERWAPAPGTPPLVSTLDEQFVIVSTRDLTRRTDIAVPASKGAMLEALASFERANPDQRGGLQVMALHELEAA